MLYTNIEILLISQLPFEELRLIDAIPPDKTNKPAIIWVLLKK